MLQREQSFHDLGKRAVNRFDIRTTEIPAVMALSGALESRLGVGLGGGNVRQRPNITNGLYGQFPIVP